MLAAGRNKHAYLTESMKVLLLDEWGAGNAIRLACAIGQTGATVYVLRSFSFSLPLPDNVQLLPPVSLVGEDKYEAIDKAVQQFVPDVVMPVEESTLLHIWTTKPSWLPLLQPVIDLQWLDCYRSRHRMLSFAKQLGLSVPQTVFPASCEPLDVESVVAELGLPVVVKGSGGASGEQVRIVASLQAAIEAVSELQSDTGSLPALQKFIDGAPIQAGGLFNQGRALLFMVGEKTRTLPAGTGPAIELLSCEAPGVIESCTTILSALGYSGIAGLDFIKDSHGNFYFLEVNPRVWGSYGFADGLGIDLFGAWYQQLQGVELEAGQQYPLGVRWAKMPEYLFEKPKTTATILRRLCRPVALKSLSWRQPYLLLHELRRIYWECRK